MHTALKLGIVAAAAALLVAGCCKKEEKTEPAAASTDSDSTGVAECDDYFAKMKKCYEKNPAAKASMEQTMNSMRDAFKKTAALPGGKDQLKKQCEQHIQLLGQNPMCK